MPIFETLTGLDLYVKNITIKKEITPVVKIVSKEKLNNRIESEIYENSLLTGSDDFYENTFGLRDGSISKTTEYGNGVFNDGNLVETYIDPKGKYESYYGNNDVTDQIVELLNDGHKGFFKGLSINYEGRKFIEKAQADLSKGGELKKRVTTRLKVLDMSFLD